MQILWESDLNGHWLACGTDRSQEPCTPLTSRLALTIYPPFYELIINTYKPHCVLFKKRIIFIIIPHDQLYSCLSDIYFLNTHLLICESCKNMYWQTSKQSWRLQKRASSRASRVFHIPISVPFSPGFTLKEQVVLNPPFHISDCFSVLPGNLLN